MPSLEKILIMLVGLATYLICYALAGAIALGLMLWDYSGVISP